MVAIGNGGTIVLASMHAMTPPTRLGVEETM